MHFLHCSSVKLLGSLAVFALVASAQDIDVTKIPTSHDWDMTEGTKCSVVEIKGKTALRLDQPPETEDGKVIGGTSLVVLRGLEFKNGEIELDVLGSAQLVQKSFIGIAIRVDPTTGHHDAIYLRPFNFKATDPERHAHAVQYTSNPEWTWKRLRAERHNEYEKPVADSLDGDGWVHVRVVVQRPSVKIYLDRAPEPSLEVAELSGRGGGLVGLWANETQPAYFANLRITHAP